jgi:hypothetical protein
VPCGRSFNHAALIAEPALVLAVLLIAMVTPLTGLHKPHARFTSASLLRRHIVSRESGNFAVS